MRRSMLGALLVLLAVPQFALAAGDRVLFLSVRADTGRELYAVDRDGTGLARLTFNDVHESQPVWSPDRTRIAFSGLRNGRWDIYTVAADGSDLRSVTNDATRDNWPKWTADGRIVFVRGELTCPCRPWIVNADGTGLAELPFTGNVFMLEPSLVNEKVVYSSDRDGSWALHVSRLNGRGDRTITRPTGGFGDFNARWSPDGTHIAFLRDENGSDNDVFVVRPNGKQLQRLTNTPNRVEFFLAWSSDGSEVLFGSDAGDLYAVSASGVTEVPLSTAPRAPFLEDFSDGRRENAFWHQISDPGSTIVETGGRLVVSIAGTAVPGGIFNQVDAHWGSNCQLPGDFDYEVDYQLLTWPQHGGFFAALNAFFADGAVARSSDPWDPPYDEQYGGWRGGPDFAFNFVPTLDRSGSMRLVRVAGTLSAYKRSPGGVWELIFSAPGANGVGVAGMGLSVSADRFAHKDGSVAYDNFRLNSGELSCPAWWSDLAPDVALDRPGSARVDADDDE